MSDFIGYCVTINFFSSTKLYRMYHGEICMKITTSIYGWYCCTQIHTVRSYAMCVMNLSSMVCVPWADGTSTPTMTKRTTNTSTCFIVRTHTHMHTDCALRKNREQLRVYECHSLAVYSAAYFHVLAIKLLCAHWPCACVRFKFELLILLLRLSSRTHAHI